MNNEKSFRDCCICTVPIIIDSRVLLLALDLAGTGFVEHYWAHHKYGSRGIRNPMSDNIEGRTKVLH